MRRRLLASREQARLPQGGVDNSKSLGAGRCQLAPED
jgi:hypothetical protein